MKGCKFIFYVSTMLFVVTSAYLSHLKAMALTSLVMLIVPRRHRDLHMHAYLEQCIFVEFSVELTVVSR
jgi:hypothetical protein